MAFPVASDMTSWWTPRVFKQQPGEGASLFSSPPPSFLSQGFRWPGWEAPPGGDGQAPPQPLQQRPAKPEVHLQRHQRRVLLPAPPGPAAARPCHRWRWRLPAAPGCFLGIHRLQDTSRDPSFYAWESPISMLWWFLVVDSSELLDFNRAR